MEHVIKPFLSKKICIHSIWKNVIQLLLKNMLFNMFIHTNWLNVWYVSDYVLVITKNNQRPNFEIYGNETDYADVSTDETCCIAGPLSALRALMTFWFDVFVKDIHTFLLLNTPILSLFLKITIPCFSCLYSLLYQHYFTGALLLNYSCMKSKLCIYITIPFKS